jgi:hypothetical protein
MKPLIPLIPISSRHIMVADKIALAMNRLVRTVTDYIEDMDTKDDDELREIELEFLCSIINDNALHIEEVLTLIESFENDNIRDKINDNYDSVTEQLVKCGQACLNRLVKNILDDVIDQYDEIYSEENWLNADGTPQVTSIIATCTDYMQDFEEFLMPFWYSKFSSMVLEEVILKYIFSILKHSDQEGIDDCEGDMVTFGRISKDINQFNPFLRSNMKDSIQELMSRNNEIDNDNENENDDDDGSSELKNHKHHHSKTNTTGAYGLDGSSDILLPTFEDIAETNQYLVLTELLSELTFYLTSNYDKAASHAASRISAYPSSAEAIEWYFMACMSMRDDLDDDEYEECEMFIAPALQVAMDAAIINENNDIAEGSLGTLYDNLWSMSDSLSTRDSGFGIDNQAIDGKIRMSMSINGKPTGNTVTHKLKMLSNIPLQGLKASLKMAVQSVIQEAEDDADADADTRHSIAVNNRITTNQENKMKVVTRRQSLLEVEKKLKKNVNELAVFLEEECEDENEILGLEEEEENQIENYKKILESKQIKLENSFDKKSPTSKMWQRRFFKLITRNHPDAFNQIIDINSPDLVEYTLMYYKKEGDTVLKAFNLNRIHSITICEIENGRNLIYIPDTKEIRLGTETSCIPSNSNSISLPIHIRDSKTSAHYVFEIIAGPDPTGRDPESTHTLILRCNKVDKLMKWCQALVRCSGVFYDPSSQKFKK